MNLNSDCQEAIDIELETAKRIRHSISTGLSFIETSVKSLSGRQTDHSQAMKLYAVGADKLRRAMADLDRAIEAKPHPAKNACERGAQDEVR